MARVTADDVKLIMDNCTLEDTKVDAYITAAAELVDQVFASDAIITDTLLTEIEKWLTAHMIASSSMRTASVERIGQAEIRYTGVWGKMLESTPYGQMVLTLDITGKMAKMGKRTVSVYAIENFDD